MDMKVESIPIKDVIVDEEFNVRKDMGDIESLKASIKSQGLQTPVQVKKSKSGYRLIAGFRRVKCMVDLGFSDIPARIYPENFAKKEALLVSFTENVSRCNLNPMEEADGIARLLEAGYTKEEIQEKMGWTKNMFSARAKLSSLPEKLQESIRANVITPAQANVIAKAPEEKQEKFIAKAERSMMVDLRQAVEKTINPPEEKPKTTKGVVVQPVEEKPVSGKDTVLNRLVARFKSLASLVEITDLFVPDFSPLDQKGMDNLETLLFRAEKEIFNLRESKSDRPQKPAAPVIPPPKE